MAETREEFRARLLAMFRAEAEEHLAAVKDNLLALEGAATAPDAPSRVEAVFREMHTLKGAARSVSQSEIEMLCQACEAALSRVTQGRAALSRTLVQSLQEGADAIARILAGGAGAVAWPALVRKLEESEGAAKGDDDARPEATVAERAPAPARFSGPPVETIRIAASRLDGLILQSEELLVPKLAAEERVGEAQDLVARLGQWRNALGRARRSGEDGRAGAPVQEMEALLHEAEVLARRMLVQLQRDRRAIFAGVDSFVEETRRIRMTPAAAILDALPRMARDLAREAGKEVVCTIAGGELEVDRKVLEAIKDPLIHLVRNAVDHGIEPPAARRMAGKRSPARISVEVAARENARIEITVADDGAGVDVASVREAAVRRHLLSAEALAAMDDQQVLTLIYRSGLSTSPIVTGISGHGLGLAITADRVEQLEGRIAIENSPGAGLRFAIELPASIATFQGLLVSVGGQSFLLPKLAVAAVLRLRADALQSAAGREFILVRGEPVPAAPLARLLELPQPSDAGESVRHRLYCLLDVDGERLALEVDRILGDREVLLKRLNAPLVRVRNVAAAALLGAGGLALVLRPTDLVKSFRRAAKAPSTRSALQPARRVPKILVVDDSITTRTMEKNLFEAMGYRVRTATDGVDAWLALADEPVDVVVSDVDMPRMNGFELTARIRADSRLANLPVILVTALEAREDKEQGIRVGANAYVIKSSLDQTNLQQIIEQLL